LRNVLIAIGNAGCASLVPEAERLLEDTAPLVRGAAIWALGRLDRARLAMRAAERRADETDADVAAEWDAACKELSAHDATRTTLICFGLGYSADHYIGQFGDRFARIVGTVRGGERAALLNARFAGRLRAFAFDGSFPTPEVKRAVAEANVALVSIPQT